MLCPGTALSALLSKNKLREETSVRQAALKVMDEDLLVLPSELFGMHSGAGTGNAFLARKAPKLQFTGAR
jgi:hypothetical protein